MPTPSAFSQARKKLKPEFFQFINTSFVNYFYANFEGTKKWKDKFLLAVDCSFLMLPETEETRLAFSPYKNNKGETGAKAIYSCLYDVLNEIPINSTVGSNFNEKTYIFESHSQYYKKDQLVIYDRLYDDYSVIALHAKVETDFLIRSKTKNSFLEMTEFVNGPENEQLFTLNVTYKQKELVEANKLPKSVRVRAIKVILDNGEVEVLLTSLLDTQKYPKEEFKWLYHQRWGIETYFHRLKNKLEIEKFSSPRILSIMQDFYGIVLLSTIESILSKEADQELSRESKEKDRKYEYKVNKSVSYAALLDNVVDVITSTEKSIDEILVTLNILFKKDPTPIRPGRNFERPTFNSSRTLRYYKYMRRA